MPTMKKGGESKKTHMAEMSKMKGLEKELKSHESKPASKGHKGLKTGGVTDGQGGYKTGGVVLGNGGGYKDGGMPMKDGKPAFIGDGKGMKHGGMATGGVKMGNAGGYKDGGMTMVEKGGKMVPDFAADGKGKMKMGGKACATGGVTMGNGGGYKKGGAAKKYAEGGAVNDSGKAEAMPQGRKKPSTSVSITELSGTFKKGGAVMTPAEKRLTKMFDKENAPAMKAAKSKDVEIYDKYGKAMRRGGKC